MNVPIEFIAKNIKKAPQFVRMCLKQKIGIFANIGIIIEHDYRTVYYVSDKEVYETFGLKYVEKNN